jgi:hypothetical protein
MFDRPANQCVKCDNIKEPSEILEGCVYPCWHHGLGGVGYSSYKVSPDPIIMPVCRTCVKKSVKQIWIGLYSIFLLGLTLIAVYLIVENYLWIVGGILAIVIGILMLMQNYPSTERMSDELVRECIHKKTLHAIAFDDKALLKSRAERRNMF